MGRCHFLRPNNNQSLVPGVVPWQSEPYLQDSPQVDHTPTLPLSQPRKTKTENPK